MCDGDRCRHCGRSLAPAAQFCGGCGIPVAAVDALTPGTQGADIATMAIPATDAAPQYPDDPYGDDPYYWEPRRRVLPWIAAGLAAALIAGGIIVAAGSGDSHSSVGSRRDGPIAMPSVNTFQLSEALAILNREGVDAEHVTVVRVPHLNLGPGTVFEQEPQPGINVFDRVTLTVSRAPDKMPDFVGRNVNAVRATLTTLDVRVTIQDLLDPTHTDGTVLEQTPPKGAPFANAVRLTVSRKPIPTNLGDLTGIGTAPIQTASTTIAGTVYKRSLVWNVSVCPAVPPLSVIYALDGHYRKLLATAGLNPEIQDRADRVHLDITVDGAVVFTRNLDYLNAIPVDIDVTGRKHLVLTLTPLGGGDPRCANAPATLGYPRLLSTADGG
jgi:hypothetical protein